MSGTVRIGDRLVGRAHAPMVIAEMSGNHNRSLDRALRLVDAAAKAGAHGLKIQTYTPDTMTLDLDEREFRVGEHGSPWSGRSLYELYAEAHLPWEWHGPIFERARGLGLIAFSTPFDDSAVAHLEQFDVPCYKIASFENADVALIRRVAATGKPLIISTGMATIAELDVTVRTARAAGCDNLILLKCTSTYPATAENTNLLTIPHLRELFDCQVGLSDHTLGVGVAIAGVALGATLIEKHFTLDRRDGGVDSAFSMEPAEMAQLVVETERAWRALGTVSYGATAAEVPALQFRRSLYIVRDIKAGDLLTDQNVRAIRPGLGLAPGLLDQVLGRKAARDVARGTPVGWDIVE